MYRFPENKHAIWELRFKVYPPPPSENEALDESGENYNNQFSVCNEGDRIGEHEFSIVLYTENTGNIEYLGKPQRIFFKWTVN